MPQFESKFEVAGREENETGLFERNGSGKRARLRIDMIDFCAGARYYRSPWTVGNDGKVLLWIG